MNKEIREHGYEHTNLDLWQDLMGPHWWLEAYALARQLCKEKGVYPQQDLVFQAFNECPPCPDLVLILGQDPYHTPGKARGVAFGYHPDYKGPIDSSLANIIQETGAEDPDAFDTSLRSWTAQGVMLLNTRLTVIEGKPLSHAHRGWEELIYEVLAALRAEYDPVVLAWGTEAQKAIAAHGFSHVTQTSHPCRYSAKRGWNAFLGSGCFDTANELLAQQGMGVVDWSGEGGSTARKSKKRSV